MITVHVRVVARHSVQFPDLPAQDRSCGVLPSLYSGRVLLLVDYRPISQRRSLLVI